VFKLLSDINISINPTKAFIGYLLVKLLRQKVNLLGLATTKDKLKAIIALSFPTTLS